MCEKMSEAAPTVDRARCSQLSKADLVSDAGNIFVMMFQRGGKKHTAQQQMREKSENI